MSNELRLTPTSYIVLGVLDVLGEATPYDLKQAVGAGLGNFWSLQHAQLYAEPERLSGAGYLSERREETGRRRRHYKVTAKGRKALRAWLGEPTAELTELRDLALLKVFFGADPKAMAAAQVPAHEAQLSEYEDMQGAGLEGLPEGAVVTLEAGIQAERIWVDFWKRVGENA